jgi:transcriptional regulator with XRE-family HTH domain
VATAVANRINKIRERAGIKAREVAQLLDTTPETLSRWQNGEFELQPDHLQRLLTLDWLMEELSELYEPDEVRLWLFTPHRLLGGERPADRIQRGQVNDVMTVIHQLTDGAYV